MTRTGVAARLAAIALVAAGCVAPAGAQDQQLVEEVVARVNADVIMRSQYLDALQQTIDDIRRSTNDQAEVERKIGEFRPRILDLMIDNVLIVQKGQELQFDVEADVNRQFAEMARQQNFSITQFEEAMRSSGVEPSDVRARLRERLMRDRVMNSEVYGGIYRSLTEREKREYYEQNREKFMQPGELKLSELFIAVEGRSFSEIESKAREVVAAVRAGASFGDFVKRHGDPNRASYANGGALGSFKSPKDLAPALATAIENLRTGDVTDPVRLADGVIVLRVDERRDAAPRAFEEVSNDVALAIVYDRSQEAEQKYFARLRTEAYIRITPGYESSASKAN